MERTIRFDWRHIVWLAALVVISVGLSRAFACAVPLAAFAALAALTMRRGVWSAAFALVGVAAVFAAEWTYRSAALAHPMLGRASAFLAAFAAYEGGLFLITVAAAPGDLATYAAPTVLRILAINATAFAGLLVVARIALGVPGGLGVRQRTV
ncbi:MAG: hypothetical protein WBD42_08400 [Methylovirgula sp.]